MEGAPHLKEHGVLLPGLAFETQMGFDDELDVGIPHLVCERMEL